MNMLAKKAKKGFTIVELVIVIAVIAILAAVLIPTFTSVVSNANESAAMQESRNEWTNYLAEVAGKGEYTSYEYAVVYNDGAYVFYVTNGEFDAENPAKDVTITYSSSFDVKTLDEYTYTSTSSKVKIYNTTKAAAAAAAAAAAVEAASNLTYSAGTTYYATVTETSTSTVSKFVMSYDSTDGWSAAAYSSTFTGTDSSAYTETTDTSSALYGYSVVFTTVSA